MIRTAFAVLGFALLAGGSILAQEPPRDKEALTASRIIERSLQAFYYSGQDMKALVTMALTDKRGGRRIRVLTMLRRNESEGGNQKYFMYFREPGDVRRMTFMVWKYPAKEDDRWIFVPAVDLVRRIAADDKRSSFVGSDFTYEDVSGRDVASDTHTLLGDEKLGEKDCHLIQSIPHKVVDYTKRISWIDKTTFLPLKEEYYDVQNELFRVFTSDEIEEIATGEGADRETFPTVTRRTMTNLKTGHRTEVTYSAVTYDLGLKVDDFSERRLRRPPRSWIE